MIQPIEELPADKLRREAAEHAEANERERIAHRAQELGVSVGTLLAQMGVDPLAAQQPLVPPEAVGVTADVVDVKFDATNLPPVVVDNADLAAMPAADLADTHITESLEASEKAANPRRKSPTEKHSKRG